MRTYNWSHSLKRQLHASTSVHFSQQNKLTNTVFYPWVCYSWKMKGKPQWNSQYLVKCACFPNEMNYHWGNVFIVDLDGSKPMAMGNIVRKLPNWHVSSSKKQDKFSWENWTKKTFISVTLTADYPEEIIWPTTMCDCKEFVSLFLRRRFHSMVSTLNKALIKCCESHWV